MINFKITTDGEPRSQKPTSAETGWISRNFNKVLTVDLIEFSNMMAKGYTWSAGVFNGQRKNSNWIEQQLFPLDFDSGVTPEEVYSRFEKIGIVPNLWYPSFSDTPEHRKFRVVLLTDIPVTEEAIRKHIQIGLMDTIGDVDKACKDAARLYYGGKSSTITNTASISFKTLYDAVNCTVVAKDATKIKGYPKADLSPYESTADSYVITEKVEHFDFDKLYNEVLIWKDFIDGVWLTHPQIFGLATAMIWIKGGIKKMSETMTLHNVTGLTNYTSNNFAALRYVGKQQYQPQRLSSYSNYPEDADFLNPITAVREKRGLIECIEEINKIPLTQAEHTMQNEFDRVMKSSEQKIYIFKLPTGIGKTRLLESVNATIALPTNSLKKEVYERMQVSSMITPEFPELLDKELSDRLDYLYSVGLEDLAMRIIIDITKDYRGEKYHPIDCENVRSYLKHLRSCYATKNSLITTHTRATHSDFKSGTIIYDEDPLNQVLSIKGFNLGDFINAEGRTSLFDKDNDITAINKYLFSAPSGVIIKTPSFSVNIEDLMNKVQKGKFNTDIINFLHSDYFVRDSHRPNNFTYIRKSDFPNNKKIVIMSATAPVSIYKELFGDRVEVIDITDVDHTGTIVQHTGKSFSRESISNSLDKIDRIIDTKAPTITFRMFVDKIHNAVKDMYFGNVAGYDSLKGKDINVLGTPHLNNVAYLLIGAVMGLNLKPVDTLMNYRSVEWNGFRFKFMTYNHPVLSSIQLDLIEAELVQAVGRARALREDVEVNIYSNLPLRIASKFEY